MGNHLNASRGLRAAGVQLGNLVAQLEGVRSAEADGPTPTLLHYVAGVAADALAAAVHDLASVPAACAVDEAEVAREAARLRRDFALVSAHLAGLQQADAEGCGGGSPQLRTTLEQFVEEHAVPLRTLEWRLAQLHGLRQGLALFLGEPRGARHSI